MIIAIITDSLGLSRKDIRNEKNWPSMVINKYKQTDHKFYFFPKRGRGGFNLVLSNVKVFKSDIIIFQIRIVDATRRALKLYEIRIIQKILVINKFVHHMPKKYHYIFTIIRNNHYLKIKKIEHNIQIFLDFFYLKHAIFI